MSRNGCTTSPRWPQARNPDMPTASVESPSSRFNVYVDELAVSWGADSFLVLRRGGVAVTEAIPPASG